MPNVVLKVYKNISDIHNTDLFVSKRGVFLYPVNLDRETFFLRLAQKGNRLVIKLEKSTMPKITSSLKSFILGFAKTTAESLNGEIIHHNLNTSRKTDIFLFDKYEITTKKINSVDWINSLCDKDRLNLEIGMGSGEFLTDEALKRKDECFIGVEVLNNDFYTALRRFNNAGIGNVKAVYYDARALFDRFKPNSLENVYLNFPEPWFKVRRIKHSVLTPKTVKEIENILKIGGTFNILTDNYPFAIAAAAIIESATELKRVFKYSFITTKESIKTKYEKKWLKYKRTIYQLSYEKSRSSQNRKANSFDFLINLPKKNSLKDDYVFKVLNLYSTKGGDERIVEITAGYSKNPQHIFFGVNKDNTLKLLSQSNFIVNTDFIKSTQAGRRLV